MADMMTFPNTWEEYEEQYGFTDKEQIYTNGSRLIQSFRVKQWLDHLESEHKQADTPQTEECPFDDAIPCEWVCTEYGHCKYKSDEPQTDCNGCEHWKYIAHEWQCETVKCQKTPQTEIPEYAEWKDAYNKMTDCGWK